MLTIREEDSVRDAVEQAMTWNRFADDMMEAQMAYCEGAEMRKTSGAKNRPATATAAHAVECHHRVAKIARSVLRH